MRVCVRYNILFIYYNIIYKYEQQPQYMRAIEYKCCISEYNHLKYFN